MNTTSAPPRPLASERLADVPAQSAVAWGAIFAGAAAAAALSLILLILGTGLGMSSVSPWAYEGISREAFGWSTIAWITVTSIIASGLGGYLAGRLRTKWSAIHADETYFRDTAHGFLAWAVATLITAAALTSAVGAVLGTGAKAVGSAAGAAATTAGGAVAAAGAASDLPEGDLQYWAESMFRGTASNAEEPAAIAENGEAQAGNSAGMTPNTQRRTSSANGNESAVAETGRILLNGLRNDALDADDARYVAQRVAEETGMSQVEAQSRVREVESRLRSKVEETKAAAQAAADEARKAAAYAALWLFITLLIGAFSASLFATFGGRQRDA